MEEIPTMYAVFILVMLTSFIECGFKNIRVTEGDDAFLNFTYSCDSKEITLQRGNGAPFYNSRNPTSPLSSNLKLRNETDGESCFLYLTINPVLRDDQGGYILTAYLDDPRLFEDDRILLLVAYPPGKASCVLSEKYIDEDWFRLHCTAPLGNIQGIIICYQDGIKIPPLNSPQQNDKTLSQTLLAKVGSLVYCCSSTLDRTKDKCDCKDSVWDPIQNKQVTNITDPCSPTVPIQHPTFYRYPIEDNDNVSSSPSTTATMIISQMSNSSKALFELQVVVGVLILVYVASITGAVCYIKRHQPKKSAISNTKNALQERVIFENEEERNVLFEATRNLAFYNFAERDGYDGKWRLVDTIIVRNKIKKPTMVGCIDECNVIIIDKSVNGSFHTYMLNMNTKHTHRVIAGSIIDPSMVTSCALLNEDKVVCGKVRSCTGDSLTGCISVYDRQWKLINDVTIPRNTTGNITGVNVVVDQDGMIIAAEKGQSKIYVINPADGKIVNTITCKQDITVRGVLSSGHIIAHPFPVGHRVFIIDREGAQKEITLINVLNVCIDPNMTDDLYVVTANDLRTCVIDQVMSGGVIVKRRVITFPMSREIDMHARVMITSSGHILANDGQNILVFKKMFSI